MKRKNGYCQQTQTLCGSTKHFLYCRTVSISKAGQRSTCGARLCWEWSAQWLDSGESTLTSHTVFSSG